MRGRYASEGEVVGGTVLSIDCWGSVTVLGTNGQTYEIRPEEGHSGTELNVYETASSVAVRGAETRKRRKAGTA